MKLSQTITDGAKPAPVRLPPPSIGWLSVARTTRCRGARSAQEVVSKCPLHLPMKRLLFVALALFAFIRLADAHAFAPPGLPAWRPQTRSIWFGLLQLKTAKYLFHHRGFTWQTARSLSLTPTPAALR